MPGGLTSTRLAVSRRGGLTAVAAAALVWLLGLVLGALIGGTVGGATSFALTVVAVPLMPAVGLPAAGGGIRVLVAALGSAALWFAVGQWSARATTRRVISGWREWARDVAPLAGGIAAGALASLVIAALVLGVL